ncbi:LOW QUALITY PROTEIN: hydroxymethylpyrimidine ABC transporter, ATPase component [Geomicrobium sp. JCM 19037]|nr:LOW QUALITY PROTEIN: hydroxymethylpyrimidine ABC transporter, ATPase component [Geomicrobium sp. JCM 19037]
MARLQLQNIEKYFFTGSDIVEAIRNVNLEVDDGEFVSIIGPSGCGKTTILSMIAGLTTPSSGDVEFDGAKVTSQTTNIGYMLQQDYLFPWLTIGDNINIGLDITRTKTKENEDYAKDLLDQMGLLRHIDQMPSELSGGMRQRAALVRTLAAKPSLLLLDEPSSALDYQTKLYLEDLIHETLKARKKTTVLVTHDISEAIAMSDRVILLSHRPSVVQEVFSIPTELRALTPLEARNHSEFQWWFQTIWKELESLETTN